MTSFRIDKPTQALVKLLREANVDIIGGKENEYIEIYETEEFVAMLSGIGFTVIRLVPNAPLPAIFIDYGEMQEMLLNLEASHSEIMKVESIGASVNNLGIWAVKISDNVHETEDEQKVLMVGSYHGDEILNVEIPLYEVNWLVENYGTDPEAAEFVNSFELWFVPLVNPDGRMSNPPQRRNMNDVDLNRNHSFMFMQGGSHGPAPFSEPETQAIQTLTEAVPFSGSLSYHSAGEDVLHPWSFIKYFPTPDEDLYYNLGRALADSMGYHYRHPYYYTVPGGFSDYMYSEFGTIAFTLETYTSKIPANPEYAIVKVVSENLIGFKAFLRRLRGAGITGLICDSKTGKPIAAAVAVAGKEDEIYMKSRKSEPDFGRYYRVLEPGTYTVVFSCLGYIAEEHQVTINSGDSLKTLDVSLEQTSYPMIIAQETFDGISGIGVGNGNGLLNRGETIEKTVAVENPGELIAEDVFVTVSSSDTSIIITTDSITFGTIKPGETVTAEGNIKFTVAPEIIPGHIIEFTAVIHAQSQFELEVFFFDTVQGFYDNVEFETDMGWTHNFVPGTINHNDDWERGHVYGNTLDPPEAHSGIFAWGNDLGESGLDGFYQNNVNNYLQMRRLNCTGWDTVSLQFFRWLTKDAGDSAYIAVNDTLVWESPPVVPFYDNMWTLQTIDISGAAANNPDVVIRFGLKSDGSGVAGGWTLDDFLVNNEPLLTTGVPGLIPVTLPDIYILYQNYPNPFNFGTNIPFELKKAGRITVNVYNVLGQKIRTLIDREYPAGYFRKNWNGLDDSGRFVASGLYFYRLEAAGFSQTRKMILVW